MPFVCNGCVIKIYVILKTLAHAIHKVLYKQRDLKTNQVITQESFKDVSRLRADPEHTPVRPWNMPEMGEGKVHPFLFENTGKETKVIIMYPDNSAFINLFEYGIGKCLICSLIIPPETLSEMYPVKGTMSQRP